MRPGNKSSRNKLRSNKVRHNAHEQCLGIAKKTQGKPAADKQGVDRIFYRWYLLANLLNNFFFAEAVESVFETKLNNSSE